MGFECQNQLNGYCRLNEGDCTPTQGKCILAGKAKLLNIDIDKEETDTSDK
jgi:hypothetical protein